MNYASKLKPAYTLTVILQASRLLDIKYSCLVFPFLFSFCLFVFVFCFHVLVCVFGLFCRYFAIFSSTKASRRQQE